MDKAVAQKIRRWTFTIFSETQSGQKVAEIPAPGFTIGVRAAAKQAADEILKTYLDSEESREPIEANRFKFTVKLHAHETVNTELFDKFIEIKNSNEMYRGFLGIACQELSDKLPLEFGENSNKAFSKVLARYHLALAKEKANKERNKPTIQRVSADKARQMGLKL